MKKIITLIFLSLLFVSCSSPDEDCSSNEAVESACIVETVPEVEAPEVGVPNPGDGQGVPNQAITFDVDIIFVNATSAQLAKFERAIDMIKEVVATEEFRNSVLNHTYNGKKTYVDNGGYTNAQIYQIILDGAEKLTPAKNNTMNMEVEVYYANNSTIGYTYANSKRVWVNRKFFDTNTVGGVASNLFHEWLHKLGFAHAVNYSVSRDSSVPYAIGRMVKRIGEKL